MASKLQISDSDGPLTKRNPGIVIQKMQHGESSTTPLTKVYTRRWLLLAIFIFYAVADIGQWTEYSVISNVVSRYYGVSLLAVDWTSLMFLIIFPVMVFPASYLIDRLGLRWTAVIGCGLTTVGSWIKVLSASPDRFYVTCIGQAVVASAQVFVISIPSRLAANWFGSTEVSSATAIGVFGTQIGIAMNFLLSPNIVKNHEKIEDIGRDLFVLFLAMAIFATVASVAVVAFFRSNPPLPPSETRRLQKQHKEESTDGFLTMTKRLLTNRSYLALWHAFGTTIGVFNALGTHLNRMYLLHFANGETDVGYIGMTMTVLGMIGSLLIGFILDKTHKFKLTIVVVCALSWIGQMLLGLGLVTEYKLLIYAGTIIFGFFNGCYNTIAFEVCAEFTYPDPEGVTTAYLTVAHQLYGIVMILVCGKVMDIYGDLWAHVGLGVIGSTALLANIMTKDLHKRQDARHKCQWTKIALEDSNFEDFDRTISK